MAECKRICVVVVNYRTATLTLDCLHSLHEQLDKSKDCVVVVDNNSRGEDVHRLTAAISEYGWEEIVHLIAAPDNRGFSAGNNIGIKAVNAQFYLLANADTIFREKAIFHYLQAVSKFPEAGLISPRLEWPDGEPQVSCFRFQSPFSELIHSASTGFITRILYNYNVPLELSNEVTKPDWTSFACVMIRKDVFDSIGLMDEGYFMYYEDVDFCRKARQAGFGIVNYPSARVVHLRGQSSGMKKMQKEYRRLPVYYYRSRARYFTNFYGKAGLWIANFCWYLGWCVTLLRQLLFGKKRMLPRYQSIDIWKQ